MVCCLPNSGSKASEWGALPRPVMGAAPGSPAEAQGCYPVSQKRECSPLPAASPKMAQVRGNRGNLECTALGSGLHQAASKGRGNHPGDGQRGDSRFTGGCLPCPAPPPLPAPPPSILAGAEAGPASTPCDNDQPNGAQHPPENTWCCLWNLNFQNGHTGL